MQRRIVAAAAAVTAVLLGACGSSSSKAAPPAATSPTSAAGSSPTSAAGSSPTSASVNYAQEAQARLAPLEVASTEIPFKTPLIRKPPTGIKVYFLEGSTLSETSYEAQFKAAAKDLNWNLTILGYDSSDPAGGNGAMEQAAAAHANYMVIGGQSVAALAQGLAAARAAKIPVVFVNGSDSATGASGNWVFADIADEDFAVKTVEDVFDEAIVDSSAQAHILFIDYFDAPVLKSAYPPEQAYLAKNCPNCVLNLLNLSSAQLTGGQVGSLVVAKLQADPSINYVVGAFGTPMLGVPQALQTAGMTSKVKLITSSPEQSQVQGLAAGQYKAISTGSSLESVWSVMDALARLSVGMALDQSLYSVMPIVVATTANPLPNSDFQNAKFQGPVGVDPATGQSEAGGVYAADFEALWKG